MDTLEGGAASGVVAVVGGAPTGLLTWLVDPDGAAAEIRALAVVEDRRAQGVGRALLDAAVAALAAAGVRRAWLVTTNDNLRALALYQKAGWRLAELRPGAVDAMRRTVKPSIPEAGEHGIPIRDELELVKQLQGEPGLAPDAHPGHA
jgi:GNAT superfamily N-acetyltransferase